MGAICLIRHDRQEDGDLKIRGMCEGIFEDDPKLPISEFIQKLSNMIKARSFCGQVLLHDPALLKHFFGELEQPSWP